MTACAVDYRADRALLAADSAVYDDANVRRGYGCKLFAMPTCRSVFFARGPLTVTLSAVAGMALEPRLSAIEAAAERLPEILAGAAFAWADSRDMPLPPPGTRFHESLLTGWSETEGRMRMWMFSSAAEFVATDVADRAYGFFSWPALWPEFLPLDRSVDTVETKLVNTLRAIDKWCAAKPSEVDGLRLGGDMTMARVTDTGIEFSTIGSFTPAPPASKKKKGRR